MRKIIIAALFLIFSINFGTSPLPPPYYRYNISGNVVCDTLDNLKHYSLVLFGKSRKSLEDTTFTILEGLGNRLEHPIDVTDSEGNYYLVVDSRVIYDSIKVGAIYQNESLIFSESHFVDKSVLQKVTEPYKKQTTTVYGCSSCTSEPEWGSRIVRYNYRVNSFSLNVCL